MSGWRAWRSDGSGPPCSDAAPLDGRPRCHDLTGATLWRTSCAAALLQRCDTELQTCSCSCSSTWPSAWPRDERGA